MRIQAMEGLRILGTWILRFLEVRLPVDALRGIGTR
jgi:hypothetical protein